MRRLLLSLSLLVGSLTTHAQTVADFESLPLTTADTYYVNYANPGADLGFEAGLAYFPCVYDTGWGFDFWSRGFAYSNMTDTVTPDYTNMYAARPAKGAGTSNNYVVAWDTVNVIHLLGRAVGKPLKGMYVTNSNYAYNSMKYGDPFAPDVFDGAESEWLKLTAFGYLGGSLKAEQVEFYLADFRSADPADHFILDSWEWMDLSALGAVDSVLFRLSCSDPVKPAYFCLDDFTTHEDYIDDHSTVPHQVPYMARVYPNPASDKLFVEVSGARQGVIRVADMAGRSIARYDVRHPVTEISTASLVPGMYMLILETSEHTATIRFQKQ